MLVFSLYKPQVLGQKAKPSVLKGDCIFKRIICSFLFMYVYTVNQNKQLPLKQEYENIKAKHQLNIGIEKDDSVNTIKNGKL